MGMTIEQCCETLFKTIEGFTICILILVGICNIVVSFMLAMIEEKLDKLLKEKPDETKC